MFETFPIVTEAQGLHLLEKLSGFHISPEVKTMDWISLETECLEPKHQGEELFFQKIVLAFLY
jgi:hypothetical protein